MFPNGFGLLLQGMLVRAVVTQATDVNAILSPQQVSPGTSGAGRLRWLSVPNKAELREITTDPAVGDRWIITSGPNAGGQMIVEELQRGKPDAQVRPGPAGSKPSPPSSPGASSLVGR